MIDDIAIVLTQEGEEIPPEYTTIPSRVRRGPKGVSLEETMMLVCKKVAAMGLCDLRFSSTVTDRYPNEVYINYFKIAKQIIDLLNQCIIFHFFIGS